MSLVVWWAVSVAASLFIWPQANRPLAGDPSAVGEFLMVRAFLTTFLPTLACAHSALKQRSGEEVHEVWGGHGGIEGRITLSGGVGVIATTLIDSSHEGDPVVSLGATGT